MASEIGIYIPNSDIAFEINKIKSFDDFFCVIAEKNEVLVYKKEYQRYEKKFLFLTSSQEREEIIELFMVKNPEEILVYKL